jgi:RNA polymerase sigma-70 factor (ECF subfamily)
MAMDSRSDADLVKAARRGDAAAFETLYYRHRDWVAGLARRICGDREAALDILQETFAYVFRKLPDLELRAEFRTFLYPVVKHRSIDRKRAHRTLPEGSEPEAPTSVQGAIDAYLNQLGEEHAEVVQMRFADGLTLDEIAAALEIPLGTVKSRLHHALEILRRKKPNP